MPIHIPQSAHPVQKLKDRFELTMIGHAPQSEETLSIYQEFFKAAHEKFKNPSSQEVSTFQHELFHGYNRALTDLIVKGDENLQNASQEALNLLKNHAAMDKLSARISLISAHIHDAIRYHYKKKNGFTNFRNITSNDPEIGHIKVLTASFLESSDADQDTQWQEIEQLYKAQLKSYTGDNPDICKKTIAHDMALLAQLTGPAPRV